MDSFDRYAEDFFAGVKPVLDRVHPDDLNQVMVDFAIHVSRLDNADNFRIYPRRAGGDFYAQASRGCCGSWDSQIRCQSGRIYWVGCNYGH